MKRVRIRRIRHTFFLTISPKHRKWLVFELRRFLVPIITLAVIVAGLAILSAGNFAWNGWRMTTGFPDRVFCEFASGGTVQQPLNSWSSLAFVIIGLWVARRASIDALPSPNLSPVRRNKGYGLLFGVALIIMGIGSWWFHASLTYVGHFADVAGMYFVGGFLFSYALSRLFKLNCKTFFILYAVVVIPLVYMQWSHPEASRVTFGSLVLSALLIEVIAHRSLTNWFFIGALASLALGFGIWLLDETGVACSPESCWQGHAMWHVLTAVSTMMSYLYYLSEKPRLNKRVSYRRGRFAYRYLLSR